MRWRSADVYYSTPNTYWVLYRINRPDGVFSRERIRVADFRRQQSGSRPVLKPGGTTTHPRGAPSSKREAHLCARRGLLSGSEVCPRAGQGEVAAVSAGSSSCRSLPAFQCLLVRDTRDRDANLRPAGHASSTSRGERRTALHSSSLRAPGRSPHGRTPLLVAGARRRASSLTARGAARLRPTVYRLPFGLTAFACRWRIGHEKSPQSAKH